MSNPAVSVIMSVFNGQAFLRPAVESILNQSFPDFEFIIIDDGSTDGTSDILAGYARGDSRIRIHRQDNQGRTASLNSAIHLAHGDYLARMDADDIALTHRLRSQIEFLETHPEVGLIGGAIEFIDGSGKPFGTNRPPLSDSQIQSTMRKHNSIWHPTTMMRKKVVLAVGGYRTLFDESEDYDLFLRIGERTRIGNLEDVLLRYRIHANQASVSRMRHQMFCLLAARAAASRRQCGAADPLLGVPRITPEVVASLGVTAAEAGKAFFNDYAFWVRLLRQANPEAALQAALDLIAGGLIDRHDCADACLWAAAIEAELGRPLKALPLACRAFFLRPVIAGRPVKRAITRLRAARA